MNESSAATRMGLAVVAISTALVVTALAVVPFLNPVWVSFEQGRTGVTALTGWSAPEVRTATDAILHDLIVGPPDFVVTVSRFEVLTDAERAHMRDVRGVFAGFFAVGTLAIAVLLGSFWLSGKGRQGWTRRHAWRGVRLGAAGLVLGTVAAGVVALVAFDAAFEVFHRLFFTSGTYRFDPATSKLVQLFPDAFWSETAVAVGALIVVLAGATAWIAGRRGRATAVAGSAAGGSATGAATRRISEPEPVK